MQNRRSPLVAQRTAERREREDSAPRLRDEVPTLATMHIEIEERRGDSQVGMGNYIRRVVIDHAPALFVVPCGDKSCQDGGHDITRQVMNGLRQGLPTLRGEDACQGYLGGNSRCDATLHYTVVATYREPTPT